MTLENETNRNIQLIAEGHLDIARKRDAALKVENEKEMLLIQMTIHKCATKAFHIFKWVSGEMT